MCSQQASTYTYRAWWRVPFRSVGLGAQRLLIRAAFMYSIHTLINAPGDSRIGDHMCMFWGGA
jgi:hypothetical protein